MFLFLILFQSLLIFTDSGFCFELSWGNSGATCCYEYPDSNGQKVREGPSSLAISFDEKNIAVADPAGEKILFFNSEGQFLREIYVRDSSVYIKDLAFLPDGSCVISNSARETVSIFSSDNLLKKQFGGYGPENNQFYQLEEVDTGPDGAIYCADNSKRTIFKFSQDGKFIFKVPYYGYGFAVLNETVHTLFPSEDGFYYHTEFRDGHICCAASLGIGTGSELYLAGVLQDKTLVLRLSRSDGTYSLFLLDGLGRATDLGIFPMLDATRQFRVRGEHLYFIEYDVSKAPEGKIKIEKKSLTHSHTGNTVPSRIDSTRPVELRARKLLEIESSSHASLLETRKHLYISLGFEGRILELEKMDTQSTLEARVIREIRVPSFSSATALENGHFAILHGTQLALYNMEGRKVREHSPIEGFPFQPVANSSSDIYILDFTSSSAIKFDGCSLEAKLVLKPFGPGFFCPRMEYYYLVPGSSEHHIAIMECDSNGNFMRIHGEIREAEIPFRAAICGTSQESQVCVYYCTGQVPRIAVFDAETRRIETLLLDVSLNSVPAGPLPVRVTADNKIFTLTREEGKIILAEHTRQ